MTEQLSIAGWTRCQMINQPTINFDQLVEAYDKTDFPRDRRPSKKEYLWQQRTILFDRWGIKSLDQLPKKVFGEKLNMSGMVRLYLDKNGMNSSYEDAAKFFAIDGLTLNIELYRFAKKDYLKKQSPDDNQHKGPRAGKPEEPVVEKKRRGRGPNRPKIGGSGDFKLILDAKKFVDSVGGIVTAKKLLEVLELVQAK